jgi:hypothetical protein
MLRNSSVAEQLAASQEGLSSMELVMFTTDITLRSVTIKFPNWGHKNHTKGLKMLINTVTQYSPRPFPHNVYMAPTTIYSKIAGWPLWLNKIIIFLFILTADGFYPVAVVLQDDTTHK